MEYENAKCLMKKTFNKLVIESLDQLGFKYTKQDQYQFQKEAFTKKTLSGKHCFFIGEYLYEKDPKSSFEWFITSSKKKFPYSFLQLSKMYQKGFVIFSH
jgi:TPR repeat protein